MTLVLIVDDVTPMAEQYAYDLKRVGGFETLVANGGREGIELAQNEPVDCIVLDLEMPGVDGFEVLRTLRELGIGVPVIVYTGTGDFDRCVQAMRLGADGFVDKAEPMERVVREVANAVERKRLHSEVAELRRRVDPSSSLIGSSEPMRSLNDAITRVAPIPSPVLILGESGSGKELVARDLHEKGRHPKSPFIAVNCAALPENLVESELFGHERGAFTGANSLRKGAFESAQDGTLFLDEIGELPLAAQSKLLRVLEQNELTRVGGNRTIDVIARVVAATNRNLDEEVAQGRFRQDLLYRLNVHVLIIPPLRDHSDDVPDLVAHFLETICVRLGMRQKRVSPDAVAALTAYGWRNNNVRELRNIVERMIMAADGDLIGVGQLPADMKGTDGETKSAAKSLSDKKAAAERAIIFDALIRNNWHITNTARDLELADHSSLLKIMRRHDIKKE